MRLALLILALGLLLVDSGSMAKPNAATFVATTEQPTFRVDFDTQVKPIFESKCMPCHFNGGKMYDSLPFDKPATIRQLGTRLFTRIKEVNDRQLIEAFLKQSP